MRKIVCQLAFVATTLGGAVPLALAQAADNREIREAIELGEFDKAYGLAQRAQGKRGEAEFDFLLGVSAVGAGRPAEAILPLERFLAKFPGNDRARLELARAYFELGDLERARQEFEFVLSYSPPPAVQQNIKRYLDSIQARRVVSTATSSAAYIDWARGYDTNVNSGTYRTTIDLSTGPIVLADGSAKASKDYLLRLAVGGQMNRRVGTNLALFAQGGATKKMHDSFQQFDSDQYSMALGFSMVSEATQWKVSASRNYLYLDGAAYNDGFGVAIDGAYNAPTGSVLTWVVQSGENKYTGDNAIRDSRLLTVGTGLQFPLGNSWNQILAFNFSTTGETNLNLRSDLSRRIDSVRLMSSMRPWSGTNLFASVAKQNSQFDAPDIGFGSVRSDVLTMAEFGIRLQVEKQLELRVDYQYSSNRSNQNLYDFRRRYSEIGIRMQF